MTHVQLPRDPGRRRISELAVQARDEGRHALARELDRLTGVEARSRQHLTIDASDDDAAWLITRLAVVPPVAPADPPPGDVVRQPPPRPVPVSPVPASAAPAGAPTPYTEIDFVTDVLARVGGRIAAFLAAARRRRNPGLRYFLIRDEQSQRIVNVAAGWVIDERFRLVLLRSGHLARWSRVSAPLAGRPGSGIDYVELIFRGRAARNLAGEIACADARGVRRERFLPFPGTWGELAPEQAVQWADRVTAGLSTTAQALGLDMPAEVNAPPPTGPAPAHPVLLGRRAHDRTSLIATGVILGPLAVLLGFAWATVSEEGLAGGESMVLPGLMIAVLMFTRLPWLLRVRYRRHRIQPDTCVHCGTPVTTRVCRRCGRVALPHRASR